MHGLDIVRMVVSARASHSFWLSVVRYDVAAVGKFVVANGAFPCLLDDLSVQQLPHFGRWPEFPKSPRMVWIFDALNAQLKSALFPRLLTTAAEQRAMNRAKFIPTEFHGNAPVWLALVFASAFQGLN
jgi:hypothetical protein